MARNYRVLSSLSVSCRDGKRKKKTNENLPHTSVRPRLLRPSESGLKCNNGAKMEWVCALRTGKGSVC